MKEFKYRLNFMCPMAKTRFFFYDVEPQIKETKEFSLLKKLKEIKAEKEQKGEPEYVSIDNHRVCLIIDKIKEEGDEAWVLGKFISSEKKDRYKEENKGDFFDIELSEEDAQLCNLEKGALFFLFYINSKENNIVLMFEMVHFSIGIGGLRTYFRERYSEEIESVTTIQKLGRDLKPILERVASSGLRMAKIKVNRDITAQQLVGKGVIEKAAPLLMDEDLDCELILKFKKGKKSFLDFLKDITHKEDVSDILRTEFGDTFRKFDFVLDNTADKKFDFFDKILRYELPFSKLENMDEEHAIYESMFNHFEDNKEDIIGQE